MISESQLIEVLRMKRHDWLNQLQLIKANLSLGRVDRIHQIIDNIVEDAQNESHLSNLKASQLTSFLLIHKTLSKDYKLIIEADPSSLDLSEKDEEITDSLETLFKGIENLVTTTKVYLTINKIEEGVQILLSLPIGDLKEGEIESELTNLHSKIKGSGSFRYENEQNMLIFTLIWQMTHEK